MTSHSTNFLLEKPLGRLYLTTASPIILVLAMDGLLTVVDAAFLGRYVGASALAAVTLAFPIYMVLIALMMLVSSGMSSLLARALGAGDMCRAREIFGQASGFGLAVSVVLGGAYGLCGQNVLLVMAEGQAELAGMADAYLSVILYLSPVFLVLCLQGDALRNEGRASVMAGLSLLVSVANVGLDWLFIARFQWGVAGSAWATILAQVLALGLAFFYRHRAGLVLRLRDCLPVPRFFYWRSILALGAPQSLNMIGVAVVTSCYLTALRLTGTPDFESIVSGYGIINRVLTFAFLPLLGLAQAMQTITGHAHGAGLTARTVQSRSMAIGVAVLYTGAVELVLHLWAGEVASVFVRDGTVIGQVQRILPIVTALYVLAGPQLMLASHFQAIGDVRRAAMLGLSKPYLFQLPLIFGFALSFGEAGLWFATPSADLLLALVALVVLLRETSSRAPS